VERIVLSWSGGKDSCKTLHELQQAGTFEVALLLTTVTQDYDRISMHGVRRQLLHEQADSLGLPLKEVFIPTACANEDYERLMGEALGDLRRDGFTKVAYGDLYLAEIRAYRDRLMEANGVRAVYPVWGRDTAEFIDAFIGEGFKAVTTCVDLAVLRKRHAGRMIDRAFLEDLPANADPCGENGEFHSFVFDGPPFAWPVDFRIGERVTRGSFCFCDLVPPSLWSVEHPDKGTERQPC